MLIAASVVFVIAVGVGVYFLFDGRDDLGITYFAIGTVIAVILLLGGIYQNGQEKTKACEAGGGKFITTSQGKMSSSNCFKVVDGKIVQVND